MVVGEAEHHADLAGVAASPVCLDGFAVPQQQVVDCLVGVGEVCQPRSMGTEGVTHETGDPGLVDGRPVRHPVAQAAEDLLGVCGKPVRAVAVEPAALVLERLGQVPMVEGGVRLYAGCQQGIHQAVVESQAERVGCAFPLGEDARPGDRKAVALKTQALHEVDVLAPAVIVVGGDIAGLAIGDVVRLVGVAVPDTLTLAVGVPAAFDLVSGGGRAPGKPLWKFTKAHNAS